MSVLLVDLSGDLNLLLEGVEKLVEKCRDVNAEFSKLVAFFEKCCEVWSKGGLF